MLYRIIIRPLLFLLAPETAHHFTFALLKLVRFLPGCSTLISSIFTVRNKKLERNIAGIRFPNPVGLAAGFDKDAKAFRELAGFGFGFIEVGTVTPEPQPGNETPRLFRLPEDNALINRMGFNNDGVKEVARRLSANRDHVIIGGNIGKNKITSNENAASDYLICFRELFPVVDYFVVNISSPNTPGLRELQEKEPLRQLLSAIQQQNRQSQAPKPVFVKVSPDITITQADDIIEIVVETQLSGIIVSNTTVSREGLETNSQKVARVGGGGLSGRPLFEKSTALLRYFASKSNKRFALIASGGIMTAGDALKKLDAGADLVQLYTGFIYEGPGLVKQINKSILNG